MGLETRIVTDENKFDVLIIGSGPASFSCAIYLCRAGLKVGYIEKNVPGGRLVNISIIENYPGFKQIDGASLALNMYEQAEAVGAIPIFGEVRQIGTYQDYKVVYTTDGVTRYCKYLVIATGTSSKTLELDEVPKLTGHGISYCAICEGSLAKGQDVVVIGGGDSAVSNAIYLSRICNKVYLIHRRDQFRARESFVAQLEKHPNIELVMNSEVIEFLGDKKLSGVRVKNKDNSIKEIACTFAFIYIGASPNNSFIKDKTMLDKDGFIIHNEFMQTSDPQIYAIGDISNKHYQQITVAVGNGTIAALNIIEDLNKTK